MNVPVFDLHCDTALALLGETVNEAGSLKKNSYHIDLERASRLEAYCQCFACYTTPMMQERFGASPVVVFEREIATIQREVEHNKNMIRLAHSMDEVSENRAAGKMSAVLTIEGPAGFDFDPELLENLRQVGFQISTLGWNEKNSLTGSNVTGGGLTGQGLFNGTRTQDGNLFAQHTPPAKAMPMNTNTNTSDTPASPESTMFRPVTSPRWNTMCSTEGMLEISFWWDAITDAIMIM